MVSQFGKECLIQYIRGPLGGSRFPWKKKIFLYHLNHSVILEKCYIKITLTNYLCKINKLQTIPLFFSVILQVKDTDINGYLHYLDFRYVCVNVCVCVGGWGEGGEGGRVVLVKNICIPHASQVGVTQSPTYQRSMGNLVPGGKSSVLNWVLKLNHLFKLFEVLNLVFACICNEKD